MNGEQWRPIPGHPHHEVSSLGRVRSLDRDVAGANGSRRRIVGRMMHPAPNKALGYAQVRIDRRTHYVHRLVLVAFVGPCPPGHETLHNDGDRGNARLSNLRYGTSSENNFDIVRHGRNHHARKTVCANGHPFSDENTYHRVAPNGGHRRVCKTCHRESNRRWLDAQ